MSAPADPAQIAAAITDAFDRSLRYAVPEGDRFEEAGRPRMAAAIQPFVAAGRPIELLLPGFPHKNPNPDKTLGTLPDLGERMALERLRAFCEAASAIWTPPGESSGCRVTIFSDGRIWGDIWGVSPEAQIAYGEGLRAMVDGDPHVRIASLDDHRGALGPLPTPRDAARALEREWFGPEREAALDRALGLDGSAPGEPDRVRVYERFVGLVRADRQWPETLAEPVIAHACHAGAVQMMIRHAAFTALLAEAYSDYVRLSVHASSNAGPKFSARLLPPGIGAAGANPLPYHCAIVTDPDGERPVPMTRAEALALPGGVEVVTRDGRPWCLRRRAATS